MDSDDKKKYLIFGVLAIIFLTGSAYVSSKQNFASQYKIPSIKEMIPASNSAGESEKPFEFKIPAFTGEEKNRITNENCGISFVIPEGWTINEVMEGPRYCLYRIKNTLRRGGSLEVGVPNFLLPREDVDWNALIQEVRTKVDTEPIELRDIDEAYSTDMTVSREAGALIGIGYPMYLFRKGQATYYMRYGYVDDGRDQEIVLDDISSVISSVQFPQDASFYDEALRSGP